MSAKSGNSWSPTMADNDWHPTAWTTKIVGGKIQTNEVSPTKPDHDLIAFWGCKVADVIEVRLVPVADYDELVRKAGGWDAANAICDKVGGYPEQTP